MHNESPGWCLQKDIYPVNHWTCLPSAVNATLVSGESGKTCYTQTQTSKANPKTVLEGKKSSSDLLSFTQCPGVFHALGSCPALLLLLLPLLHGCIIC
jgi:hypothetical protein